MNDAAIAIIPARGGSRRVPRKNIREMLGEPLIHYTVRSALQSDVFDRVLVSTDSREIADSAEMAGAEVPFLREAALADDVTPVSVATADMLKRLDPNGDLYAHVCQLMPNCPLRNAADLRDSYHQYLNTRAISQISVVRYGWQNPWWGMRRNSEFVLEPLFPDALKARSQDLPELFCPTGAVWWARTDVLLSNGTFHVKGRTGWEISWQHGMDIDTEEDWAMAELLMRLERGE